MAAKKKGASKGSLKEQAQAQLSEAKRMERMSDKRGSNRPTQGEVAQAYIDTGDLFANLGDMYEKSAKAAAFPSRVKAQAKDAYASAKDAYRIAAHYAHSNEINYELRGKIQELRLGGRGKRLEYDVQTTLGIFAISALVLSLVSISFNLTGFAVSNPNSGSSQWSWLSIGLFILGLAFTLFYFRFKKKK